MQILNILIFFLYKCYEDHFGRQENMQTKGEMRKDASLDHFPWKYRCNILLFHVE